MDKKQDINDLFNDLTVGFLNVNRYINKHDYYHDFYSPDSCYLNNYKLDDNGNWVEIPYTCYGDYVGSSVEMSNYKVIESEFQEMIDDDNMRALYGDYFSHCIVVKMEMLECEEIQDIFKSLSDYPLLNDDHFSELEHELEMTALQDFIISDIKSGLLKEYDLDTSDINDDQMTEYIFYLMERHNIYFEHEMGLNVYLDIDVIVNNWNDIQFIPNPNQMSFDL